MADIKDRIINETISLLANEGAAGASIRRVATRAGVKQPTIYYHFGNKDKLMNTAFRTVGMRLGMAVRALPDVDGLHELLRQRVIFHLEQSLLIMAMLNYFLLDKRASGSLRIPPQAYAHIKVVIDKGVAEGAYQSQNTARDASIIVHALNGFAMEHFPNVASAADLELVEDITSFVERALRK